jgi:hypothetical protein
MSYGINHQVRDQSTTGSDLQGFNRDREARSMVDNGHERQGGKDRGYS